MPPLAELLPFTHGVNVTLEIVYVITILSVIGVVISENRNPVKSLAWVTVLVMLPVVGLFIYLFFGRSLKNVIMVTRKNRLMLRGQEMQEPNHDSHLNLSNESKQMIEMVNSLGDPHFFPGNQIDIFTEGATKFDQMKADLLAATTYINFQYYIFSNDKIGHEIASILMQKAQAGVAVRVIYDHVGSFSIASAFFKKMRKAGVEAYPFLKVTFPQLANRINWRNHRKIVVIDGKVGYIGGMNVADRYVSGEKGYREWRDTHLRITGNAVKAMQYNFAIDWNFMKHMLLTQEIPYSPITPNQGDGVQIVASGPTDRLNGMAMVFLRAISLAKKRIYIQTPYFLPEDGMMKALQAAALSGVDVRLMIPRDPDSKTLRYSSFSYVKECLEANIRVFFYTERMLHSKCVIVDEEFCTIGSTNFDFRSLEHNFECNALIYSKDFNQRMCNIFETDATQSCSEIALEEWVHRPWKQRTLESLARLLGPIL